MYLLDTDHLSLIQRGSAAGQNILTRLTATSQPFATTIVTYEEQSRGWLAYLSNAKTIDTQVSAYSFLQSHAVHYRSINIFPFSTAAAQIYQTLRRNHPRLGSGDLKIAAIVIAHEAILLTRNIQDFGQIQNLQIEDWT
jgi:tRNA(fMet)-specific endonuclease VapC